MNRIVHFEIQAEDTARAAAFYKAVFGWEISKWEGGGPENYWMVMTGPKDSKEPGINGGMLLRPGKAPAKECGANAYVCSVIVENIDATISAVEKAGGTVAMPKFAIGDMAWQAYYHDTEGNIFGIHQPTGKGM